jgi:hypothetical protein
MSTPALTSPSTTTHVLGSFLERLGADGASEKNRRAHECAVQRLGEFLRPRPVEHATSGDLRAFLSYLGELGVSKQSQEVYRSVLDRWIAFCATMAPALAPMEVPEPIDVVAEPMAHVQDMASVVAQDDAITPVQVESTWPFGGAASSAGRATRAGGFAASFDAAIASAPPSAQPAPTAWPAPPPAPASMEPAVEPPPPMSDPEATWCVEPASDAFGSAASQPGPPAEAPWNAPLATLAPSVRSADGTHEPMSFGVPAAAPEREALAPAAAFGASPAMPATTTMGVREIEMGRLGIMGSEEVIPIAAAPAKKPARDVDQHDAFSGERLDASPGPRTRRAPAAKPREEASPQWTARLSGGDKQIEMTALRNMVLRGEVGPKTAIRRDGGEWMRAGDYAPLKGSFTAVAQGTERVELPVRPSGPIRFAVARAFVGASLGMVIACMVGWMTAVILGHEVNWSMAVAAPLVGLVTCATCRSASGWCVPLAGVASLVGMFAGRICVHETLAAGLTRVDPSAVPDIGTFLVSGITGGAALSWMGAVGLACAVAGICYIHRPKP